MAGRVGIQHLFSKRDAVDMILAAQIEPIRIDADHRCLLTRDTEEMVAEDLQGVGMIPVHVLDDAVLYRVQMTCCTQVGIWFQPVNFAETTDIANADWFEAVELKIVHGEVMLCLGKAAQVTGAKAVFVW